MTRPLLLLIISIALFFRAEGQTQPFGIIDTADLKMTSCDFEKDANAEILFDKATVRYKADVITMERHKRIKIFTDKGKDEANIRIEYLGVHNDENITDIEAETINLNNGSIEYINVDPKLIYTEIVDKETKALIFTFPEVKPGSVIEFKYKWTTPYPYNYPDWVFQAEIPSRYSEFDAGFSYSYTFEYVKKVHQPFSKDTTMAVGGKNDIKSPRYIWALSNIASYKVEPYMDYPEEYLQRISLNIHHSARTWITVGNDMLADEDFGEQLTKSLAKEDVIIKKANALKTDQEKIAYLFDTVRNAMKWNKIDRWYCDDGVKKAWDKKAGNSTEINLILYHFLALANVDTYLLALKTRDYGRLDIGNPTLSQINKTVVYCKIDSTKHYVLDASDKLNTYFDTPFDLIGLYALSIEAVSKKYEMLLLQTGSTREVSLINGTINADGKLEGINQISSSSYSRKKYLELYNELGEKKYIDKIQKDNDGLKITSLKLENIQNDTLPLNQTFEFKYNLTSPDGDYMYFNPNLFTGIGNNPFLDETRVSNIDFGCLYSYSINGRYKMPPGYKIDALPKSVSMQMPDKGITFTRFAAEQDGFIIVHYTIDFKKEIYTKDEYPSIRDFYKKMYEMLNEQIVLKKS